MRLAYPPLCHCPGFWVFPPVCVRLVVTISGSPLAKPCVDNVEYLFRETYPVCRSTPSPEVIYHKQVKCLDHLCRLAAFRNPRQACLLTSARCRYTDRNKPVYQFVCDASARKGKFPVPTPPVHYHSDVFLFSFQPTWSA